ncbi:MAG: DUF2069 domain-containing protein [Glaciimonas sp.]|nr:DUF2069 domain-containing protein [Glaciimonas sp.]
MKKYKVTKIADKTPSSILLDTKILKRLQPLRWFYFGFAGSLLALIVLCVVWEIFLEPLRPGGSWMVLKVVPLMLPLHGALKRDIYTLQWSSMLILIYFAEGIVRATSDSSHLSAMLGGGEVALTSIYFVCSIMYLQPYKKAAKATKVAIEEASRAK